MSGCGRVQGGLVIHLIMGKVFYYRWLLIAGVYVNKLTLTCNYFLVNLYYFNLIYFVQ